MLKAKKIRLDVSEQDAATLEFMQGKCRGLYNWLVMRLRAGERWHFAEEKARLGACRAYDSRCTGPIPHGHWCQRWESGFLTEAPQP